MYIGKNGVTNMHFVYRAEGYRRNLYIGMPHAACAHIKNTGQTQTRTD